MNQFLEIEGVTKRFGNRRALDDVSFSIRRGEVLGLIGPNGAGKTTLFECLAGLMWSDDGAIKADSKILPASRRKQTLFYLPDAIVPWADQSVKWVLQFFEQLYDRTSVRVSSLT